jgi:two-component sensor histidine kinase
MSPLFSQNIDSLERELSKYRSIKLSKPNHTKKIELLKLLGQAYFYKNSDSSFYYMSEAWSEASSTDDTILKGKCAINMGKIYFVKNDLPLSKKYYLIGLTLLKSYKNKAFLSSIYVDIGECYLKQSEVDSGLYYINNSIDFSKKYGYRKDLADAYVQLGMYNTDKGNYKKAINYFLDAVDIYKSLNNKFDEANIYNNLSLVYIRIKDFEAAIKYSERAIKLFEQVEIEDRIGSCKVNIGLAYFNLNNQEKALENWEEAAIILRKYGQKSELATTLMNLASILLLNGELDKAFIKLNECIEISKAINDQRNLAGAYINLATYYDEKNKYFKAIKILKEAEKIAQNASLNTHLKYILRNIADGYEGIGQHKEALDYMTRYSDLKDSLLNQNTQKQVQDIKIKYETAQVQDSLNYQTSVAIYQKRQTCNISIGLILALLALVSIGILYARVQKQKVEIEKQKDISDVLFDDLRHRVGNNIQTITKLLSRQERMTDNSLLKNALSDIKQRMNTVIGMYNKLSYSNEIAGTVVNMEDYLKEIVTSIVQTASLENTIQINTNISKAIYSTKQAHFIGLITNEVVTNAIKHNADKLDLSILVKLNEENGKNKLTIKDNGSGLPNDFELRKSKSLGMSIINSLSKNIKADYQFYNDNGTCFELIF